MRGSAKVAVLVVIALVVVSLIFSFIMRASIISSDESSRAAWGDIQAQLQRRLDLIPNLVSTVEGAAQYESSTLEKIVKMRSDINSVKDALEKSMKDQDPDKTSQLYARLVDASRKYVSVAVEAYPQLKAVESFLTLQSQLEGTENRISVARQRYNDTVRAYHARTRTWSWLPFCSGFAERKFFEAAPEAEKAPTVKFNK